MFKKYIVITLGLCTSLLTIMLIFIQAKLQSEFPSITPFYFLILCLVFGFRQLYNYTFIKYASDLEYSFYEQMFQKIVYTKKLPIKTIKEELYVHADKYFKVVLKNKINFVTDLILFSLIISLFISINVFLGVVSLLFILALFLFLSLSKKQFKENIDISSQMEANHIQSLRNYFKNIKYYNKYNSSAVLNQLNIENEKIDSIFNQNSLHGNKYKTFYRIFNEIYVVLSLFTLLYLYNSRLITLENLFLIFFLVTLLTSLIRQISNEYLEMQYSKSFEYKNPEKYQEAIIIPRKIGLIAKSISVGEQEILRNIELEIENNSILIIGQSGIGKSVLLKTILGLNTEFNGVRKINDQEFDGVINKSVGYLSDIKVRKIGKLINEIENINIYSDLLKKFSLTKPEYLKQEFLNDIFWSDTLSTGEYRRFLVILELLKKPKFLFLDEALDNIDWATAKSIINTLNNIKDLTCVVVSHNSDFKSMFTKIYEVKKDDTKLLQK
jgi:ABC-type multidrug transport system ATPase subunit